MKWNKEIPHKAEEWVATNGLMQPFGASLVEFLIGMGIDQRTHYRWLERFADYADGIKKGTQRYTNKTIRTAESGLKQLVSGSEEEETITKYVSNAQGQPIIAERRVRKFHKEPNTAAVIFALTNLQPECWKNRQNADVEIKGQVSTRKGMSVQEAQALLQQIDKEI